MHAPTQPLPQAIRPALLAALVDEVDRAQGRGLILPVLKLTLLIAVPAQFIEWAVRATYPGPEGELFNVSPHLAVIGLLLVAPAIETAMMRFLFWQIGKWLRHPPTLNLGCALLWGALHARSPTWGLHAVWGFYVLGAVFLRLQARSLNRAYAIVILIHALFNFLAYGAYLLG